ncbi:homeobox domain-containing protein [Colletotrichum abscissum]|uniref:Homeobox domain-containing protein n=1 Tax=Colletotrichum abscissum TaxID=1671311 RepID=A0A9P9XSU0_9PEZI|nr:homeobox domain-containing protein [Colletotrichum abscissum]KAI3558717.1 homeobox domain-containing protein [Colletotrichum abscissum]KAK1523616.1 homeobox domain-containing protein [Colletotrichum abscissum]
MSVSDISSQALVGAPQSSSSPSPRESSFRTDQPAQTPTRQPLATGTETPDFAPSSSVKTEVSNPDSERHPKGKRKRTAAKDKSILEAAYVANPKPDKAARLDIVKRVSLNEKEVQIWFQNRRQNDRRKSRPLSAQEIAALRYGGMQILSSDPVAYTSSLPEEQASPVAETAPINAVVPAETPVKAIQVRGDEADEQPQHATPSILSGGPETTVLETPLSQVTASSSQPHSTGSSSFSNSVGFFTSSHWNAASAFSTPSTLNRSIDETPKSDLYTPASCSPPAHGSQTLPSPQSSQQSQVRLSLSLEGKAELVSNENSPPRFQPTKLFSDLAALPQPRIARPLQRSHSALPSVTLPPITALTDSLPPALGRGRSRDAHAWELCCDADTRDELTTQAEDESNGSAVAAISLLRSTSGVLQNNSSKRNCPASRPASRPQQAKKPKLCRTSSSMARMQTSFTDSEESVSQPGEEKSLGDKVKVDMLISPSGDSDKENWTPENQGNMRRLPPVNDRRPLPATVDSQNNARRTGRTLQDHPGPAIFSSSRARTMPAMGCRGSGKYVTIFEDEQSSSSPTTKGADEVESFMRGGDVSPSKKGDMDCIAGLLSLSQGAWR